METLVLEVEAVITELMVEVFTDCVKSLMYKHDADNGAYCIDHPIGGKAKQCSSPHILMYQHTCYHKVEADGKRINHHRFHIKLQLLPGFCTNAGNANTHQFHKLAPDNTVKEFQFIEERHEELGDRITRLNR